MECKIVKAETIKKLVTYILDVLVAESNIPDLVAPLVTAYSKQGYTNKDGKLCVNSSKLLLPGITPATETLHIRDIIVKSLSGVLASKAVEAEELLYNKAKELLDVKVTSISVSDKGLIEALNFISDFHTDRGAVVITDSSTSKTYYIKSCLLLNEHTIDIFNTVPEITLKEVVRLNYWTKG